MIRVLLTGTLYGEPLARTSANGKPFVTAKLRADGKDGVQLWCSIIAFGEQAERLATLKPNAALAVAGRAEVSAWTGKDGMPAAGLSLVVDELATLKGKPKPQDTAQAAQRPHTQHRTARQPEPADAGMPFDDLNGWRP